MVIEMTVRQVPCGAPHGYRRHRMRSSMSSLRLRFSPTCTTSLLRFWSSSRLHILLTALCVRFWALQPILACQSPLRRTGRNDTLVLGAYLFLQRSTQKVIFDLLVKYDYIVLHTVVKHSGSSSPLRNGLQCHPRTPLVLQAMVRRRLSRSSAKKAVTGRTWSWINVEDRTRDRIFGIPDCPLRAQSKLTQTVGTILTH